MQGSNAAIAQSPPRQTGKRWHWRDGADICFNANEPTPSESSAVTDDTEACDDLTRMLNLPPLVADLLVRRGHVSADQARRFLEPKLTHLHDPAALPGADDAARRIVQALGDHQPIVIYSDYDVDGVTAASILWHTLTLIDPEALKWVYTPDRAEEGYGLNNQAMDTIAGQSDRPPLVVSVDCGISAVEVARHARQIGVELIVTDHHHVDPDDLPEAHTLVHPRIDAGSPYPNPHLCGAGVAFKLAWQIANVHCGCAPHAHVTNGESSANHTGQLPEAFRHLLMDLLSLAALGTVADVVPLVGENRVLTVFGLGRIKQTRFTGLNALIDEAKLRYQTVSSYHVGFVLGPRLNACGRMGHARHAVKLLTDADPPEANELASFLNNENDRRRQVERTILDDARELVSQRGDDADDRRAIVVAGEDWHPGVVGIVASRLVDTFHRPTVVLNLDPQTGLAQGSARSVDGVCIHTALTACENHLTRFGGHAMAAGLTLQADGVEAFRDQLIDVVNAMHGPERLAGEVEVDGEITLNQCTLDLFERIGQLAPFGRGNPTPRLLLRNLILDRPAERMGREGKHLSLFLREAESNAARSGVRRAVGFGMGERAESLPAGARVHVVFKPQVSTWRNQRRLDMHVEDLRFA